VGLILFYFFYIPFKIFFWNNEGSTEIVETRVNLLANLSIMILILDVLLTFNIGFHEHGNL